jgi:hypothetical protein
MEGNPEFDKAGIPRTIDLAKTPEQKQIIELAYTQEAFGRPYILPPGVPPQRVAALRKGFMETMADPEFLAEAKTMGLEVHPMSGEQLQSLIEKMYALPRGVVERTHEALIYKPPS